MSRSSMMILVLAIAGCAAASPVHQEPIGNTRPVDPHPVATEIKTASLTVTALAPIKGDADGGTYVVIKGSGFLTDAHGDPAPASAKIYFGSRQGEIVRFASDKEIIVQAPGGKPGEVVDVLLIFEGRGEQKLPNAFTFVDKSSTKP